MANKLTRRELWGSFAGQGLDPAVAFKQMGLPEPKVRAAPVPRAHPNEHQEQNAVIHWWWKFAPTKGFDVRLLFAIPNGAHLHGDGKSQMIQRERLKREGLRSGVPDLMLAVPRREYHGLFVEMKTIIGFADANQREYHDLLMVQGYDVHVCKGAERAIDVIRGYVG